MKKGTKNKYSRAFSKRDAKHYLIYSYLNKLGIKDAFSHAEEILKELETRLK